MTSFKKNIWLFYFTILVLSVVLFTLFSWQQWDHLKTKYANQQISTVQLFSSGVDSMLSSNEVLLGVLEARYLHDGEYHKSSDIQLSLDEFVEVNAEVALITLINPDGTISKVSSGVDTSGAPNFLESEYSQDSFLRTLRSKHAILGRTHYVKSINSYVIPVRKAIRDKTGKVVMVADIGLKVMDSKLFNYHQHGGEHHVLTILRDDSYRQFISSGKQDLHNYTIPVTIPVGTDGSEMRVVNWYRQIYPKSQNYEVPYLFYTYKNKRPSQVVIRYLPDYDVWVSSRVFLSHIRGEYVSVFAIYTFIFLVLHICILMMVRSIATNVKDRHEELVYQANHDLLTGLPNRLYLRNNKNQWINSARVPFSLLFIDMDNFKTINDTYGHEYGDMILKQVASRLKSLTEEADLLVREAGDEFIVLTSIVDDIRLINLSEDIVNHMSFPYQIGSTEFILGCSIGIVKYPDHGVVLASLLRAADIAMYRAKKTRGTATMFTEDMHNPYMRQLHIERRLSRATEGESLFMVYQPQLDADGKIYGVEALARWNDDELGMVCPDQFISIAENCGLMPKMGEYILYSTLEEISKLQKALEITFQTSINISVRQFTHKDFLSTLMSAMHCYNVEPSQITLEITENLFIEDLDGVLPIFEQLKALGFTISLDDFGTGYSSLSMLRYLPIDELKIDKSFIDNILTDPQSLIMVENIISIGNNLDITLLAEGVETQAQEQLLRKHKCYLFQGYYYAKPMPYAELLDYVSTSFSQRGETEIA